MLNYNKGTKGILLLLLPRFEFVSVGFLFFLPLSQMLSTQGEFYSLMYSSLKRVELIQRYASLYLCMKYNFNLRTSNS